MSTNEQLGELHKEAINTFVSRTLIDQKPDFNLAACVVMLLEAVIERESGREIDDMRKTLLNNFPDYAEKLVVNGITRAEVFKAVELDEQLETVENAIALLTDKPKGGAS